MSALAVSTALTWGALALARTTPTQRSLSCENR